jgi:two-component system response regulator NreC
MPLRILLADDHLIVRQGVKQLLTREGYSVVAEAADGREAVRLAREHCPDVAVLDLGMPLLNGVDAVRHIRKVSPNTKAILLTFKNEMPYVLEAFRAGAKGYVLKTHGASELFEAIRKVTRGTVYISPDLAEVVPQIWATDFTDDPVTPREREVLQLIAEGKTTKEVATLLGISFNTAESHRNRIMKKLNIHETAGLVRYAIRRGLTSA